MAGDATWGAALMRTGDQLRELGQRGYDIWQRAQAKKAADERDREDAAYKADLAQETHRHNTEMELSSRLNALGATGDTFLPYTPGMDYQRRPAG